MDFDFSDDQKFLQEEARKFLSGSCTSAVVRSVLNDSSNAYDAGLWKAMGDMGWLGMSVPEKYGGMGLSQLEVCVVAEELGRVTAPIPFSSTIYLFTEALLLAGTEEQQNRLLPLVAKGELIGCLATSEGPGTGRIKANVTGGRLTGTKIPVTDGDVATHAVVLALEAHELGLFLIDLSTDGVSRKVLKTLDPTRSAAELCFQNVAAERLGPAGAGEALLNNIIDRGAVLIAFEQIGGADQALEMARNYALERYSFGRPIGSFQAIKHRLADMYIRNQLARSNAYFGAWMLSEGSNTLARAAAAARIAASEAYWFAAKETIEIFGGIGTTWEVDCHLHYRRAKQLALMVGGPVVWRERLVSSLEHDNAPSHAGVL